MLSQETREKAQHGEQFFPLRRYITILDDFSPIVTPHWHEEAEFTQILEGHCTYQVNLETVAAAPGDLLFIPPEVLHSITVVPGEVMRSETFVFHMNFLGNHAADACAIRYLTPIASHQIVPPCLLSQLPELSPKAKGLFLAVSRAYQSKENGYELRIKSALLLFMAELLPYCTKASRIPTLKTEHIDKIKTALDYIGHHYAEPITVQELADLCYFNEYHFMRFFKKYVGMSCVSYIKTFRLDKAAALLRAGKTPLDASLSTGFGSLSYFYREFKKQYHMTPKEYQEQLAEPAEQRRPSSGSRT